jgi:hypothetical protein
MVKLEEAERTWTAKLEAAAAAQQQAVAEAKAGATLEMARAQEAAAVAAREAEGRWRSQLGELKRRWSEEAAASDRQWAEKLEAVQAKARQVGGEGSGWVGVGEVGCGCCVVGGVIETGGEARELVQTPPAAPPIMLLVWSMLATQSCGGAVGSGGPLPINPPCRCRTP